MRRLSGLSILAVVLLAVLQPVPDLEVVADVSTAGDDATVAAVKKTLNAQVAAWNDGDIPGFMEGYVDGKQLRFASGNTVTRGWQTTLQRYQKRYSDRKSMGRLTFSDLTVTPLSTEYAEVFGRFHLSRDRETGDATGLFTLLMQQTETGWLVLHDHTSSAE